jgi:hypothetical protein
MISVVIPYVELFSKYNELKYALRSIEQNLQGEFEVVIVGDQPAWCQNVRHIKSKRISIGSGSNLNDLIKKMMLTVEDKDISGTFLRWYDDVYLLKKAGISFFDKHFVIGDLPKNKPRSGEIYKRQLWETQEILRKRGVKTLNCETHLPRVFNKAYMRMILIGYINFFGDLKQLMFQSLYYNTHWNMEEAVLLNKADNIKAGFYGREDEYGFKAHDVAEIRSICRDKHILNHNDSGWSHGMQQYLQEMFPNKSRFEK